MKFVFYATGTREGQVYKSRIMQRAALNPAGQYNVIGRLVRCGECLREPGTKKIFPIRDIYRNARIAPGALEELIFANRSFCFCCKNLCNAEEGFYLSRLENEEELQAGTKPNDSCSNLRAARFFGLFQFLLGRLLLHLFQFAS